MKKIFSLIILASLCVSLFACTPDVDPTEQGFVIKETGEEYIWCRGVFAVNVGDVFFTEKGGNGYCTIINEEAQEGGVPRFLCENDNDLPYVYRINTFPDFTVESFEPIAAQLWLEGDSSAQQIGKLLPEEEYLESYWSVDDLNRLRAERESERLICEQNHEKYYASYDYVYMIRDTIAKEEVQKREAPTVNEMDLDFTLHIRLLSAAYPGLYYEVVFWRDTNGMNYLYDMEHGNSYFCPEPLTYYFWGGLTE